MSAVLMMWEYRSTTAQWLVMCQGYQLPQAAHPQVLQAGEICTSKVLSRRPSMSHFLENIPRSCKCFQDLSRFFQTKAHLICSVNKNSPFFVGNQKKRQEILSNKSRFHVKFCFVHPFAGRYSSASCSACACAVDDNTSGIT